MTNQTTKTQTLLKTNVDVEPVGVIYNLSGHVIEESVMKYFEKLGIQDAVAVRLRVEETRHGKQVSVFAFFKKNSENIISNLKDVPDYLRSRMGSNSLHASEKLKSALRGLTKDVNLAVDRDVVYVRLNIFNCLAIVLNANPKVHEITINDIQKGRKKDEFVILSVIKSVRYRSEFSNPEDKYSKILDRLR